MCSRVVAAAIVALAAYADDAIEIDLRLGKGIDRTSFSFTTPATITGADSEVTLPAGTYNVHAENTQAALTHHRLFIRSLPEAQRAEAELIAFEWLDRGHRTQLFDMGHSYRTDAGTTLDNRMVWVSIGFAPTEAEAKSMQKALNKEGHWPWVYPERVSEGVGQIVFTHTSGEKFTASAPCTISTNQPTRFGAPFDGIYDAEITFRIGDDAKMEVQARLPLDIYLAGVLPAEMPALWPLAALEAQAITARSDVLAHRGMKHSLEGFDFTVDEMNRVFRGEATRHQRTDDAVAATRGTILVTDGRITPGVFSSNCGGFTADNDTVWSAPPDDSLRARPDAPGGASPSLSERLRSQPDAYCRQDTKYFRWTRTITAAELSNTVNKSHKVGTISDVRMGDRGPSGRLKWVEVIGSGATVRISKEYPIRQAFGGLPSAMFILDRQRGSSGVVFTLTGGGRGHGVGMCQHGARGMADQGKNAAQILGHYFNNARIEKVW